MEEEYQDYLMWEGNEQGASHFYVPAERSETIAEVDDTYSFLQFALFNFRESLERYEVLRYKDNSVYSTIKQIEYLKQRKKKKIWKKDKESNWTWRELTDMVKFSKTPISSSLLCLSSTELNTLAVECFTAIMKYMGDQSLSESQTLSECVYSILVSCYKNSELCDEIYCQLMKQTTNNKSIANDGCVKGWRLFCLVTSYFECSQNLKPYLLNYLLTVSGDENRNNHDLAKVCLQNLKKTFEKGGRRNVPSTEEIINITAGELSRSQVYYLPGGIEKEIKTSSTTIVEDIIENICNTLGVTTELEEYCLYCIVEGDTYTIPLSRDEYILDIIAELQRNGQPFYLIFCRSVWYTPLLLENELYIEIIFHQVIPDYLEGFMLVVTGKQLNESFQDSISRIAALLHRAADMTESPQIQEVIYLVPKPALQLDEPSPVQWARKVQENWPFMVSLTSMEAKAQCLGKKSLGWTLCEKQNASPILLMFSHNDLLQKWSLFGTCFFPVQIVDENDDLECFLAVNKEGLNILDDSTHETLWKFNFIDDQFIRSSTDEELLLVDMMCYSADIKKVVRLKLDHAFEVFRLIEQYRSIMQKQLANNGIDYQYKNFPKVVIKV